MVEEQATTGQSPSDTRQMARRAFLSDVAVMTGGVIAGSGVAAAADAFAQPAAGSQDDLPIIDTHQHLWNLQQQSLPWLSTAPAVLNRNYGLAEYKVATEGLNVVKAVYMEVDVHPDQQISEGHTLLEICRRGDNPTVAAVISGRPGSSGFAEYMRNWKDCPEIKGIRQVLHPPSTQRGLCLEKQFVQSMQLLGEMGLSFDLCMRPGELEDAVALAKKCPETQFILDHCGNASPAAFLPKKLRTTDASHDPEEWKKQIGLLADCANVVCKISGVIASAPADIPFTTSLAPIVNHCLDVFGPDRVIFGGDWPVCLLGGSYRDWVTALREIISERPKSDREKLWSANAQRIYRLPA